MADPGFPRRQCQPQRWERQPIIFDIFFPNWIKRGARVPRVPLGSVNDVSVLFHFLAAIFQVPRLEPAKTTQFG